MFLALLASQAVLCLSPSSPGSSLPQTPQRLLENILKQGTSSFPPTVIKSPFLSSSGTLDLMQAMRDQSFICARIDEANIMVHLSYFLNCMQFACLVNR